MLPTREPLVLLTRQVSAVLLSLMLSCWSTITIPQAARAIGIDAGTFGATGGMIDCSDSGILVAFAGAGKKLGNCPLYHTDVNADVSGYVARVSVKQQFHNPYKEKIEAVYTFPLPENAAVDEMTMKIGNRVIKGNIKKKEEARQVYETARAQGHVASLLDQERPNIFTQSVANIEPGQNIDIEIKYVNTLKYEDGSFTFFFPTVVGPRFIPGRVNEGRSGFGTSPDTDMVPDASKITPRMVAEGERAGHDISINLNINAGVPIQSVQSKLHEVDVARPSANIAQLKLKNKDKIPNKDFVATWNVAAGAIQSGYLTHREGNDGFFTLMLIPPKRVTPTTAQPKEMIFLVDCSGSQRGRPIEKAKEVMHYILDHMNPQDTFQVITFNNSYTQFADHSQLASAQMKDRANNFVSAIEAHGGTWMAPAVDAVCALPNDEHRLRIVTFMTDGFVGNDMEILGMIKKYRGKTRWYSFGTGNNVNRFLVDNIAKEGGGEADYVLLNSSAEEAGKKFYDRISSPVLTDINVEFNGVETREVFPKEVMDLWAQKPVFITGRYNKPGAGKVVLSGYSGGKPYKQEMKLDFPATQSANDVLPSIWARAKVERLMSEDWRGLQFGQMNKELKDEITNTALKYHIMSQFTSFVAVEEDRKTKDGNSKTVAVPVEHPDGLDASQGESGYYRHSRGIGSTNVRGSLGAGAPGGIAMHGYNLGAPAPMKASRGAWSSGPVPVTMGGGGSGNGGASSGASLPTASAPLPMRADRAAAPSSSFEHYGHYEPGAWARKPSSGLTPPPPSVPLSTNSVVPSNYYKVPVASHSSSYGGGAGLPQTNMGKFVHQSGDNQYSTSAQTGSSDGYLINKRARQRVQHYNAPREVQIVDERPIIKDYRSAPESGSSWQDMGTVGQTFSPKGKEHKQVEQMQYVKPTAEKKAADKEETESVQSSKIGEKLRNMLQGASKNKHGNKKIRVKLELTESPGSEMLDEINKAGLSVEKRNGKFLIGHIELGKIEALAQLACLLKIELD